MIIIADTSPLNYLLLIGEIDVLQALFQKVIIPTEVLNELRNPKAPAAVRAWSQNPPKWLQIENPTNLPTDEDIAILGDGERAAIALALEMSDTLLLIDEGKGRRVAKRRHIRTVGTLGILEAAAARNMTDLPTAIERLRQTTFYVDPHFLEKLLERDKERTRNRG